MEKEKPIAPQWSGRVSKSKITQVYEDDARGIQDDKLLTEVAYTLFSRCKSMVIIEEARNGRATCPVCEGIIEHPAIKGGRLDCGNCSWSGSWNDYRGSMHGKHLIAPGIQPFCREYIQQLPKAKTPKEKMVWIDWLIHRVHWEGTALPGQPGAVCLIQGRAQDVNAFLSSLSAGTHRQTQNGNLDQLWSAEQKKQIKEWRKAANRRNRKKTCNQP